MRILVVGAGAIGGYFGGRLLEVGRDVTFLVRPGRAEQLAQTGVAITSCFGNVTIPSPSTVLANQIRDPFDLVLLSCKAYDLEGVVDAISPAVGPSTVLLPLLNGMRHLDLLDERFGAQRVLGGTCLISARLDHTGRVVHLNDAHRLTFGERPSGRTPRVDAIAEVLSGCRFEVRASEAIFQEMWQKWVFLATLAGLTCLMRASIRDIMAGGGADLADALLEECRAVAVAAGWPPRPEFLVGARAQVTTANSPLMASMLGDIERGARTEAEHVLGDLLQRRGETTGVDRSLLRIAYTALKTYEARMGREKPSLDRFR